MCRTTRPRRDSRRPQRSRSKRKTNPDAGAPSARARHRSHHHSPRRRRLAVVGSALAAAAIAGALFTLPHTGGGFADTTGSSGNFWNSDTLDPPTSLSAADGATVTVDWTATVDSYATGHRIFRSTSTGGPYSQVAEVTPRTTTTYIDNPSPGTYYYVARAYSGGWESVDSNEDSATVAVEDFDAIAAGVDNCPTTFNIDQYDTDGDGTGDACDASPTVASAGAFTDSGQTLGSASSLSVSLADVDGDGDLDAMTANDGAANKVWLNNGSGTYTDSGQNLGSAASVAIGFGDLDGDGDVDAMVANDGAANKVWLNNGSGTFTDSGQALANGQSMWVALGDTDGDGDLDAMVASDGAANKLWLNNGSGTFTDSGQNLGTANSEGLALGDVDGDGDLDAMSANVGQANKVWINTIAGISMASGSYTGDGADSRSITGAGFQPVLVIVKCDCPRESVWRTSTMAGGAAKRIESVGNLEPNLIESLDADGFTVGAATTVNASGDTYYWAAFAAGAELSLGTYTGDGSDNRSITGVGFQPDWVFTLGDGEESVQRPGTQVGDGAHFVWGGDFRLDKIQAMEADGFQLGSHSDTNASGVTFHYVAWNASGNVTQASYVGNGNDNRSITGVGFSPDMLWVKRNSNNPSAWRPTALSGDAVLFFGSNNQPPADRIQAIEPDGFQIGTHEQVNASGSTYHYMAING